MVSAFGALSVGKYVHDRNGLELDSTATAHSSRPAGCEIDLKLELSHAFSSETCVSLAAVIHVGA